MSAMGCVVLAATLALLAVGEASSVKVLGGVMLKIVRDRSEVMLIHYYEAPAESLLEATVEKVTERVSRAGHTAGSVAVVAAVDLRSSPGDTPPSVSSFPALVLHVKGGEMERDEELAICAGLDACNALDDSVIFASIAEKVAAYSARIGTNVTIPSLAECEHAVAVAEVLLAEEDEKKPIPANGTRAICSDSTNCGDCRLAGCGWCRIAQLCVVDLPNGCNGQRDHIGVNGFSESCDDTECNSMDCCVQIDQKCGMIEANFGAEVWRDHCDTPLSTLVPGAPAQLVGMLCPCSCRFCPDRACTTTVGESAEETMRRNREYQRMQTGKQLDEVGHARQEFNGMRGALRQLLTLLNHRYPEAAAQDGLEAVRDAAKVSALADAVKLMKESLQTARALQAVVAKENPDEAVRLGSGGDDSTGATKDEL